MISDLVTKELQVDVFPTEGKITADLEQDIVKVAVIALRAQSRPFVRRAYKGVRDHTGFDCMQRPLGHLRHYRSGRQ